MENEEKIDLLKPNNIGTPFFGKMSILSGNLVNATPKEEKK